MQLDQTSARALTAHIVHGRAIHDWLIADSSKPWADLFDEYGIDGADVTAADRFFLLGYQGVCPGLRAFDWNEDPQEIRDWVRAGIACELGAQRAAEVDLDWVTGCQEVVDTAPEQVGELADLGFAIVFVQEDSDAYHFALVWAHGVPGFVCAVGQLLNVPTTVVGGIDTFADREPPGDILVPRNNATADLLAGPDGRIGFWLFSTIGFVGVSYLLGILVGRFVEVDGPIERLGLGAGLLLLGTGLGALFAWLRTAADRHRVKALAVRFPEAITLSVSATALTVPALGAVRAGSGIAVPALAAGETFAIAATGQALVIAWGQGPRAGQVVVPLGAVHGVAVGVEQQGAAPVHSVVVIYERAGQRIEIPFVPFGGGLGLFPAGPRRVAELAQRIARHWGLPDPVEG